MINEKKMPQRHKDTKNHEGNFNRRLHRFIINKLWEPLCLSVFATKKKLPIFFDWGILYGILLGFCFVFITWVSELYMVFGLYFWEINFNSIIFDIEILHIEPFQWIIDISVFVFGLLIFIVGGIVNYRTLKKRREKRRKIKIKKMQIN